MARPQAPTPSLLSPTADWLFDDEQSFDAPVSPSSAYIVDSPSALQDTAPASPAPRDHLAPARDVAEDDSFLSELRSEEHTSELQSLGESRMPSSA